MEFKLIQDDVEKAGLDSAKEFKILSGVLSLTYLGMLGLMLLSLIYLNSNQIGLVVLSAFFLLLLHYYSVLIMGHRFQAFVSYKLNKLTKRGRK